MSDAQLINDLLLVMGLDDRPMCIATTLRREGWDCVPRTVPARMNLATARQAMIDLTLAEELDWPKQGTRAHSILVETLAEYDNE